MIKKEIVQEALDWDQGLVSTFLTLFSDPRKVVTNPDKFTKPWKYATYVVSISCVFTWFFIHSFVEAQGQESFWLQPKRMLELTVGYQNFYESSELKGISPSGQRCNSTTQNKFGRYTIRCV